MLKTGTIHLLKAFTGLPVFGQNLMNLEINPVLRDILALFLMN